MKILGCDLHAKQQSIAMLDTETGELTEKTLSHEGNEVREFYAALEGPVVVGIEATGAMQWFLELLEELGIVCRVGHPAKIRAAETRKQKHDRRDARLMLDLLMREDGFPEIWMPSSEQRELTNPSARPISVPSIKTYWLEAKLGCKRSLQSCGNCCMLCLPCSAPTNPTMAPGCARWPWPSMPLPLALERPEKERGFSAPLLERKTLTLRENL
jgi:hypothetical protein